ncbi:hypothetical protein [Mesorhizobium cantuariense]|uniref:Uncharacterized protein n=1 Tax=Mesorhizobium cantuariense TaxID=1300275 RepID=A0ABV7MZW5_9HYPH
MRTHVGSGIAKIDVCVNVNFFDATIFPARCGNERSGAASRKPAPKDCKGGAKTTKSRAAEATRLLIVRQSADDLELDAIPKGKRYALFPGKTVSHFSWNCLGDIAAIPDGKPFHTFPGIALAGC